MRQPYLWRTISSSSTRKSETVAKFRDPQMHHVATVPFKEQLALASFQYYENKVQ